MRISFKSIALFIVFALIILSCDGIQKPKSKSDDYSNSERDLDDVFEEGVLRVITIYSSTNYFLYKGQPMGYEFDLARRLAEFLNVKLEIIVAQDISEMLEFLKNGEGDVIAAGLTITNERKAEVRFTNYLYLTNQVLVQRKPENWRQMMQHEIDARLIKDPIDLIGDTVFVPKNSSFYKRLKNIEEETGGNIHIQVVDGDQGTEKLISMVVDGEIKYTVADKNVADINASYYPILDVNTSLSSSQRIAWALRKSSQHLGDTINFWIEKMKKYNEYYAIYDKYFKSPRSFRKRIGSDFYSEKTGKISPYDEIIKRHIDDSVFDWRLISSLIYQESNFDPEAVSWANAGGLMQVLPSTAEEMGIADLNNPEDNIRGGLKYLKLLWKQWDSIEDSVQRLKFTFASYNCGIHHLYDAQFLAKKEGKNPNVWDDSVELELINLTYPEFYRSSDVKYGYVRGKEPVNYVSEIFERFEHYKTFIPL